MYANLRPLQTRINKNVSQPIEYDNRLPLSAAQGYYLKVVTHKGRVSMRGSNTHTKYISGRDCLLGDV